MKRQSRFWISDRRHHHVFYAARVAAATSLAATASPCHRRAHTARVHHVCWKGCSSCPSRSMSKKSQCASSQWAGMRWRKESRKWRWPWVFPAKRPMEWPEPLEQTVRVSSPPNNERKCNYLYLNFVAEGQGDQKRTDGSAKDLIVFPIVTEDADLTDKLWSTHWSTGTTSILTFEAPITIKNGHKSCDGCNFHVKYRDDRYKCIDVKVRSDLPCRCSLRKSGIDTRNLTKSWTLTLINLFVFLQNVKQW